MAMSKAKTLPEEIVFDILSLLPAKFIGHYRCVSKQWRNLLSDPQFIKAHHIIHAHKKEEKLIYISVSHALHTITFNQNGTDAISKKLNFPELPDNWLRVIGSCNGLVLVVNRQKIKYLFNPTTLKYHRIPKLHLALPAAGTCAMSGLGYDFATDDYKVVTLSRYIGYEWTVDSTFIDVYSVRMGLWRRLECIPHDHIAHHDLTHANGSGVLVNGALHWMARKAPMLQYSSIIVAFDLTSESFSEVPTPTVFGKGNLGWYNLVALRGCLLCILLMGATKLSFG
ncbi:F-box protein CPR1-like [Nicotiana tabacum]|uniref:F-box protein CPR1-like n=2 Tax=Nicotiana TaxID=4085 RepID=A0A1S3Z8B5_TOBAC|nr:PREDICTED: F-box protein CPR30-like [Nicotiana sylvestris]XP_016460643.1 PREDICTED: F-box protein CPR30-like [Nicotiana tabacum]